MITLNNTLWFEDNFPNEKKTGMFLRIIIYSLIIFLSKKENESFAVSER